MSPAMASPAGPKPAGEKVTVLPVESAQVFGRGLVEVLAGRTAMAHA